MQEITADVDYRIRAMIASGLGLKEICDVIGMDINNVKLYCEKRGIVDRNKGRKRDYIPGSFKNCDRCKSRTVCKSKDRNAYKCGAYIPDYALIMAKIDRNRMIREWNERDR